MSDNQAEQYSYVPKSYLDPPLYEWPQNRLPSIQSGCWHNHDQGQTQILPPLSAYSTDYLLQQRSFYNIYPSETQAYSHYEEQQYEKVFSDTEQAYSQVPSPINNSDLQLDSTAGGNKSFSDQHRLHQFNNRGIANYRAKSAPVNDIMTANEHGPGQPPLKPSGTPLSCRAIPSFCFCPTCGAGYANKEDFQSHFLACMAQNGNPSGVHLDSGSRTTRTAKSPPSERIRRMNERLDAVSGVVIPSKLAAGESPWMPPTLPSAHASVDFACPRCEAWFGRMDHVKSHFPACVDRNGNPEGLRWNERLPVPRRGPKASKRQLG